MHKVNKPVRERQEQSMTVAEVVRKMVEYSKGDLHDINHFIESIRICKNNRRGRKSESGAAEAGGGDSSCA